MNDLKVFDQLAADITIFVAPTKSIKVTDAKSSNSAIEVAQNIKSYLAMVDKKRKELVGPLNAQVKAINDYCKHITAPLDDADTFVRSQLNVFAAEQARLAKIEAARIEAERIEIERKAQEARAQAEEELRIKQEAEAEAVAESIGKWGADNGDVDAELAVVDEKQQREWAEEQARLDREAAVRDIEAKQRQYDANEMKIKNTRGTMKVRILDVNLIPKEFLIVTPNEKALIAVGKSGMKIPGVEFYEEFSVAIGSTTRMAVTG